jgi:hypothetical protein
VVGFILTLVTVLIVAQGWLDGSSLNPVALFTGFAAFSVSRAAWGMRPR